MLSKKNKAWLWETGLVAHKEDTDFRRVTSILEGRPQYESNTLGKYRHNVLDSNE